MIIEFKDDDDGRIIHSIVMDAFRSVKMKGEATIRTTNE